MPVIGITGGIATGKSAVTAMLKELGAITFSADDAAREVLAPDSEALKEVVAEFGPEVMCPDGTLDRQKLAGIIFADSNSRKILESITHPRILALLRKQIDEALNRSPPNAVIAVEAPLLFESGMEDWFDQIVVVISTEEAQIRRLNDRSNMTQDEAGARIRAQMPLSEKAARAHCVIDNSGSIEQLREAVIRLWPMLAAK